MKPGSKVKIVGLTSDEGQKLNNLEGIVDHYSRSRERYGISIAGQSEIKMIKQSNLQLVEETMTGPAVFGGEEEMLDHLKQMGMPSDMLQNLTPEQKQQMFEMTQRQTILERATKLAGVDAAAVVELKEAEGYAWRDASDHVYLEVNCGNTGKVKCKIDADQIEVVSADTPDRPVLRGTLFQNVLPQESKWEQLGDGILAITLQKASPMRWLMVLR